MCVFAIGDPLGAKQDKPPSPGVPIQEKVSGVWDTPKIEFTFGAPCAEVVKNVIEFNDFWCPQARP